MADNSAGKGQRSGREEQETDRNRTFDWKVVHKDPKTRQKYLGNSVKAPLIRGGRDPFWWSKNTSKATKTLAAKSSGSRANDVLSGELRKEQQELREKEAKLLEFYLSKGMGAKAPDDLLHESAGNKKNFRRELRQRQEHYPLEFDDIGKKGGRTGGYN